MGGQGGYEWRSEAFVKIQKKILGEGPVRGGGSGWRGQGGWERRIEAFVIFFFFFFFFGGGGRVGGGGGGVRGRQVGGQGGCEQRSKVFVKIQKKKI